MINKGKLVETKKVPFHDSLTRIGTIIFNAYETDYGKIAELIFTGDNRHIENCVTRFIGELSAAVLLIVKP